MQRFERKMRTHGKLQAGLMIAIHLFISSTCQGCHIEVVECDYEYEYVDVDPSESSSGNLNVTEYPELEIQRKNCRVVGSRHRRTSEDPIFDFFNRCISDKMPEKKLFMPTLVDFMMHHTTWYKRTEAIYCRSDTVACWRSLCGFFLRWESKYIKPVKQCIQEFGVARGRNVSADKLKKPHIRMPPDQSGQFINENIFLSSLKNALADVDDEWTEIRWKELIQFYQDDYICSYNFCNCTGLPVSANERCGDNWLTRLVGSTHPTSKYREPLIKAASDAMEHAEKRRRLIAEIVRRIIFFRWSQGNATKNFERS